MKQWYHLDILTQLAIKRKKHGYDINRKINNVGNSPPTKGIQYTTISAWHGWTMRTQPLEETYEDQDHMFINHSLYPDCAARNLKGKNCMWPLLCEFLMHTALTPLLHDA